MADSPLHPDTERVLPATKGFSPRMTLAAVFTALALTSLWVLATWLLGIPLVILPLVMGVCVGAVVGRLSPCAQLPQGVFAALLALTHTVGGTIASTVLIAMPPETPGTFRHTWNYLQNPGVLRDVLRLTFTPMDVLIYGFVAGSAYAMVVMISRRQAPEALPVGNPLPPKDES